MREFLTENKDVIVTIIIVINMAFALGTLTQSMLHVSPYRPEHTETIPAMDAALSEQFGQRLATLGVAAIVIEPVLSDNIWYSESISANCRNRAFADDNDCYAQPMAAIDARGQRVLRFSAYGTPIAEITVDKEGHVTARLREGTKDLLTFDSAMKAALDQIARQVALMEAEEARRASWTADSP